MRKSHLRVCLLFNRLLSNQVSYMGRQLSAEEWKFLGQQHGLKGSNKYPGVKIFQILKQDKHAYLMGQKASGLGRSRATSIETVLKDEAVEKHEEMFWITLKSLSDYLCSDESQSDVRNSLVPSLVQAAFCAKQWKDVVEIYERARSSEQRVAGIEQMADRACVSYGKLGRFEEMMELYWSSRHLALLTPVVMALHPVGTGKQLADLHDRVVSVLMSGEVCELSIVDEVLKQLFGAVVSILSQSHVTSQMLLKALNVLLLRSKLHQNVAVFAQDHSQHLREGLSSASFKFGDLDVLNSVKTCPRCESSFWKCGDVSPKEVDSLKEVFLSYLQLEATQKRRQSLLEQQLHIMHQRVRNMGGRVDIVLDGFNAAYSNVNTIHNFDLYLSVLHKVRLLVHSLDIRKVLILLPDDEKLLKKAIFRFDILEKKLSSEFPTEDVSILKMDKTFLDDKFVLYAALLSNCYMLTNDFYRDHILEVMKAFPRKAQFLPRFIMNRRVRCSGMLKANNLNNSRALRVHKPLDFDCVSQFSLNKCPVSKQIRLTLHEPVSSSEGHNKMTAHGSIKLVCASKWFTFEASEILRIENWTKENLSN